MQEGITFFDLVVIGALAVFIYTRFINNKKLPKQKDKKDHARVIDFPKSLNPEQMAPKPFIDTKKQLEPEMEGLDKIKAIEPSFNKKEFLQGCESAFKLYHDALNNHDEDTLDALLAPRLFDQTVEMLEELRKNGQKLQAEVVSIHACDVLDVRTHGRTFVVEVRFEADVILYKTTDKNTMVKGESKTPVRKQMVWTLARPAKSDDPNWEVEDIQTTH